MGIICGMNMLAMLACAMAVAAATLAAAAFLSLLLPEPCPVAPEVVFESACSCLKNSMVKCAALMPGNRDSSARNAALGGQLSEFGGRSGVEGRGDEAESRWLFWVRRRRLEGLAEGVE